MAHYIPPARWKKGESGNPKGRPKNNAKDQAIKLLGKKRTEELYDIKSSDIDGWERMLLAITLTETNGLAKWEDSPAYPRLLAIGILTDIKNGRTNTIERIRARQFPASRRLEITGGGGAPLFGGEQQTLEEMREELARLQSLSADTTDSATTDPTPRD